MNLLALQKKVARGEFDYQILLNAVSEYKFPKGKIQNLLKNKVIIRVKKGLYVFSPEYSDKPYHPEVLANLIYGPSYISFQWALSFYGLIPERVELFTNATLTRDKDFTTPIGRFTYKYIHPYYFHLGVMREQLDGDTYCLIAGLEKAILDTILNQYKKQKLSPKDFEEILFSDLRIEKDALKEKLSLSRLLKMAYLYEENNIKSLVKYFEGSKKQWKK